MSDDVEVVFVRSLGPKQRLVTFKASVELVRRLDAVARRMGKSRSEVIREAIEQYLAMSSAGSHESPRYVRIPELVEEAVLL